MNVKISVFQRILLIQGEGNHKETLRKDLKIFPTKVDKKAKNTEKYGKAVQITDYGIWSQITENSV